MANEKPSFFKRIVMWLVAFVGGILTALCLRKRDATDLTSGFNNVREELGNTRTELSKAKDNISELNGTIDECERAIKSSRSVIDKVKSQRQQ